MNPYLKKEIQLLRPAFVTGLLLTISFWLIPWDRPNPGAWIVLMAVPFFACPALIVMMALDSFGREMSGRTFSGLLAQPISRNRIWWTKSGLLACGILVVLASWWLCLNGSLWLRGRAATFPEMGTMALLFVLVTFSGGLWTVLLFRQVAAAFWFTLLTPAGLTLAVLRWIGDAPESEIRRTLSVVLGVYAFAGFALAWWLFQRAQDVHWTGGAIRLPRLRFGLPSASVRVGRRSPRLALFLKELQLQQSNLLIATLLALTHLMVLGVRNSGWELTKWPLMDVVLSLFWALWLIMPLLVSSAAVAEERNLGTLEGMLCMPIRRRAQFWTKVLITLLISLLLGAVMPILFEGTNVISDAVLMLTGVTLIVHLVGFYASTVSRSALHALAPAGFGLFLTWLLWLLARNPEVLSGRETILWRGPLIFFIGVPTMILTLAVLAYRNFRPLEATSRFRSVNLAGLSLGLAVTVLTTTGIYHRVWELAGGEPGHGAGLWSISNRPSLFAESTDRLIAHFPDGPVWLKPLAPHLASPSNDVWLEGSDWVSVDITLLGEVVGVRRDGTLWGSHRLGTQSHFAMKRLGEENDWRAVVARNALAYGLKTNGSLWRLGRVSGSWSQTSIHESPPVPLSSGSDWEDLALVSRAGSRVIALRKTDGRVYLSRGLAPDSEETIELDTHLWIARASVFETNTILNPEKVQFSMNFSVAVGADGTLRVVSVYRPRPGVETWDVQHLNLQLGSGTNWIAVAALWPRNAFVTLRSDGTLWKWTLESGLVDSGRIRISNRRLSRHSDWLGIAASPTGFAALAADGSIWLWMHDSDQPRHNLLGPSRRPIHLTTLSPP